MRDVLRNWLIPAYLGLCLVLGGASAAGLWANALLQLLAVALLFWTAVARNREPLTRAGRQLLALACVGMLIPLLQLIPLPPAIWTGLPGREHVEEGFALVGEPLPWLPISLSPSDTIYSLLWLLPAVAILFELLRRGVAHPERLAWVVIGVMGLSVLIGAMQITGGTESPWYFYRITNYGVTVGFFSNANHMATLLVVALPFLAAICARDLARERRTRSPGLSFVVLVGAALLVAVGLVINGSLAGLGLMLPVALASVALLLRRRKLPVWAVPVLALITAASVATVLSGRFDNNLIGSAAYSDSGSRYTAFRTTLDAAMDYFPYGSGIGTFVSIYRTYEIPEQVTSTFMNHAHGDYFELFLETGLLGLGLVLLFLWWWVRQTMTIWRSAEPNHFARAASIASAAILAHSIVDYPLRTVAIASVFAVCCALMANWSAPARRSTTASNVRPTRHLTAD